MKRMIFKIITNIFISVILPVLVQADETTSYNQALELSVQTGKPILLEFYRPG
jgi:hypothetical protein